MAVIKNTWVEKQKKKKVHESAPSYESDPDSDTYQFNAKKPVKRHSHAARATMVRTLRGVRK